MISLTRRTLLPAIAATLLAAAPAAAGAQTDGGGGGGGYLFSRAPHALPHDLRMPDSRDVTSPAGGGTAPVYVPPPALWRDGTAPLKQDLSSPDGADAARAGEIAQPLKHYDASLPAPKRDDPTPLWPPIAFAGLVLAAVAGRLVRIRTRARRVAA